MTIPDHHIQLTAQSLLDQHGADAVVKARERVKLLQARGDMMGADIWLRVIVAVGAMQKPAARSP